MASVEKRAPKRGRVSRGPAVLAAVLNGASLDAIATTEQMNRKSVEKALRDELRKRWIAPAQDHARLQIARLEPLAALLKEKATRGDLPTVDRLLKVLDRLDRYHGFTKLAALSNISREDVRSKLAVKIDQAGAGKEGGE